MGHVRHLAISSVVAILAAVLMVGTVAAVTPQVTVISDSCSLSGGAWNHGTVALRVRAAERDLAGITVIRFTAVLMHQPRAGGSWTAHQTQVRALRSFSIRTWTAAWNFGSDTSQFRHRVEMTIDFMRSNGTVLATRGVFGSTC